MTINYTVWVFNQFPQLDTCVCPNEVWSQLRYAHKDFWHDRVFGCPVYVLEPKLQDGKKTRKLDLRAHLEMFVEFSSVYSSLVALVLDVRTGNIYPQYHVTFDVKFEIVTPLPLSRSLNQHW